MEKSTERKCQFKIRHRRLELNITPAELARRSGLTPAAIHYIENGHSAPTEESIRSIARALDVEPGELF